mgnify:CR=1 FL=1|jgi:type I restriction enzyme S subunit
MEKKRAPKLRFRGFTDDWEQRKVGELTNVLSASRVHKEEWAEDGIPFFRSSDVVSAFKGTENEKAFISIELYEKLAKSSGKLEQNDILITGGGSIGIPYIVPDNKPLYSKDADLIWIKHSANFDSRYLYTYFIREEFREYLASISHTGTIAHYTIEQVKDTPVRLPLIDEQRALGDFFVSLDHLITLHQRKYDMLQKVKKSMLEKMFPKNGSKVPEIRFSGFTDDREQRKLDDLCELITKQTGFDYSATIKPSLLTEKADNTYSFIQNKDFTGNEINMETDFYIPIEVAERFPKILIDKPSLLISISGRIGNIGFYRLKQKSFIGGAVGICKLKDPDEGEFITQELESEYGQRYFQSLIKASSHANITVEDIRNIELIFPPTKEERKQISDFLLGLDNLITLHQRKLEKLKKLKKSMLEEMFV